MPNEFFEVGLLEEIKDPGCKLVELEDRLVLVFHVDGDVSCLDDICTHDGGPLSDGEIKDGTIACPRHGAKFDIKCGKALTMPATEDAVAHEVKVENGKILMRLSDA